MTKYRIPEKAATYSIGGSLNDSGHNCGRPADKVIAKITESIVGRALVDIQHNTYFNSMHNAILVSTLPKRVIPEITNVP